MVYDWKVNVVNITPQIAGNELARIERKYGSLTPESVVDESRDVNAVLHNCFEWDDAVAAEKYRHTQARHIIGNFSKFIRLPAKLS